MNLNFLNASKYKIFKSKKKSGVFLNLFIWFYYNKVEALDYVFVCDELMYLKVKKGYLKSW